MLTKNRKVFENIVALKKTLWKKGKVQRNHKQIQEDLISLS